MLGGPHPVRRDAITGWNGPTTEVPVDFLQELKSRHPLPITIGGANNVTFTLNASVTHPVRIWNGSNFINKRSTIAFTWTNTANAILTSTGAIGNDVDSVLGIWYMYLNGAGDTIYPSQTGPNFVESINAETQSGLIGHPGTSRADNYVYIGFMECTTAATPAFRAAVKIGFWYKSAPRSHVIITDAWGTPTEALLCIPALGALGDFEIQGTLETGADGAVFIGGHSASTIWDAELDASEAVASNVAQQVMQAPVRFSCNGGATNPYYAIAAPAGDFHLLGIKDIV